MAKAKGNSHKTVVVVFNPGAGHVRRVKIQHILEQPFSNHHLELIECSDEDLLPELLRPWINRNVDLVIAAGGDGTISSVASSLRKSDIPLGILPLGTGNVLASELGIPTNSRQAAKLLAGDYDLRLLDAIAVDDRSFLLSVSVGISAITMHKTQANSKRRFGKLAYVWTFISNVVGLSQHQFNIELDGKEKVIRASEIIALNSGILGSRLFRWGPNILPDDGYLDVCFIRTRSIFGFFRIVIGMLLRLDPEKNRIEVIRVKEKVRILSPVDLIVQGDGDFIGKTPIEVRLIPAAIKIAVPKK
jgi:diacylglycerol kinase family enzyme